MLLLEWLCVCAQFVYAFLQKSTKISQSSFLTVCYVIFFFLGLLLFRCLDGSLLMLYPISVEIMRQMLNQMKRFVFVLVHFLGFRFVCVAFSRLVEFLDEISLSLWGFSMLVCRFTYVCTHI